MIYINKSIFSFVDLDDHRSCPKSSFREDDINPMIQEPMCRPSAHKSISTDYIV